MTAKTRFLDALKENDLKISPVELDKLVSENLISPFVLEIPVAIKNQAQELIAGIYGLRSTPDYLKYYSSELGAQKLVDPGNKAIAMSYDVHWDVTEQKIKLIEINTNAAFLFLSEPLYRAARLSSPIPGFDIKHLIQCCENEIQLSIAKKSRTLHKPRRLAVIDENPEQQRLYIEFLFVQNFLQCHGWDCEILDYRKFKPSDFDFIYNRFTDFYFESPESEPLRQSFLSGETTFSPNPFEYFLLADKQRMIDWCQVDFWNFSNEFTQFKSIVNNYVPRAQAFSQLDIETIWLERKKYFFKPKNSFGSKMSYRGSSISRKLFDTLPRDKIIRQEFVAAPEVSFLTPDGQQVFKYDLRLFAYEGVLQTVVARLYQGQVTNLQTKYGGYACVKWI